jgi:phosphatidylglycerol---prolipoprotein diacylglyceryl transferase
VVFPIQFYFGSAVISAHFIFEVLAYVVGFQYLLYLRRNVKDTVFFEQRMWIILAGAAGALVGSRCVGFFSDANAFSSGMDIWIGWMQSKSILGGLLGGIIGVEIGKQCMGIKAYTGDLFVYPIILGMVIGRLGCFSQGVFDGTHGNPSQLPWAMDMGDGIPRHPAQLYEILFLIFLWFLLKHWEPRLISGARFKLFATGYFLFRFFIEFIKPVYVLYFGLSAVQIASLVGLIYCLRIFIDPGHIFEKEKG